MQKTKHSPFHIHCGRMITLLVSSALISLPAYPDELSELRDQIASLQQRLDVLEAKQSETAAPKPVIAQVNRQGLVAKDDHQFSFRIRPRIQIDSHYFPDDEDGTTELSLRRIRPVFQGEAGGLVSWRFMPELAGTVRILDAWADLNFGKNTYLRIGKFKGVIGLERLQSFSSTLFMERGLPSVLTPTREIGLEFHQSAFEERLQWTLAIYNGSLDDTDLSCNTNLSSGDFDIGARLEVSPWKNRKQSPLEKVSFGIAASTGPESTLLANNDRDRRIRYRTSGRNTFFRYVDGVEIEGDRIRLNPFFSYYCGPVGILSEYVSSSYDLRLNGQQQSVESQAWTVQANWILTGESATYKSVRPANPFAVGSRNWGAFEIGLRIHSLEVDETAFSGDETSRLAHNSSVQKAHSGGAALNWYLTDNVRIALNYEVTDFSGLGANRPTEEVWMSRFQLDF